MSQLPDPKLMALKAQHAPRLDRQSFDDAVDRYWPQASKAKLSATNREAMWVAHQDLGISPMALSAGFAHALKSGVLR